jgi:predicted MFS family arabinose efflux permease
MSPIYLFLLPSLPRQDGATFIQKIQGLDWLGSVLNAGLYISFVVVFSFGGTTWAWDDSRIVALLVIFGVVLVSFCLTQYYSVLTSGEARIFPCEFLRSRSLVLLYICMACGGAGLFVAFYYIPLYFQFVHGDSGTQAAVRLLPFVCFYVATVVLCGWLMPHDRYYAVWYLVSGIFMTISAALLYTSRASTPAVKIYGYSILLGIGMATTQAGYAVGPTMVKPERVAEVIQFMNIAQGQGQLLGLAIASAIFQSLTYRRLSEVLSGAGFSHDEIRAAIAGARSTVLQEAAPDLKAQAIDAIVRGVDDVYVMVLAAGALYIICAPFLKGQK